MTTLPRRLDRGVMLSHADDGTTEMTWPKRDINAKSCW
jgi:hypothetical protein